MKLMIEGTSKEVKKVLNHLVINDNHAEHRLSLIHI